MIFTGRGACLSAAAKQSAQHGPAKVAVLAPRGGGRKADALVMHQATLQPIWLRNNGRMGGGWMDARRAPRRPAQTPRPQLEKHNVSDTLKNRLFSNILKNINRNLGAPGSTREQYGSQFGDNYRERAKSGAIRKSNPGASREQYGSPNSPNTNFKLKHNKFV